MFKSALQSVTAGVIKSAKTTAADYIPGSGSAFNRVSQQGIANLSYRSPILADMAASMLANFQQELEKTRQIKEYVKADASKGLREQIKSELGPKTSDSRVTDEMLRVVQKMNKLVESQGQEKAGQSDLFKKYGDILNVLKEKPAQTPQSGGLTAEGSLVDPIKRIDTNTSRTAQLLSDIVAIQDNKSAGVGTQGPTSGNASYIDPLTGLPSIKAAIGGIGGTFLSKVFDDELLTKYADKLKGKISGGVPESFVPTETKEAPKKAKVQKAGNENKIVDILKDLSLDLSTVKHTGTTSASSESSVEANVQEGRRTSRTHDLQTATVEELKKLNDKSKEKDSSTGGILDKLSDGLMSRIPGLGKLGGVGSTVMSAARAAAPALAVAGAGAAGYAFGSTVVNPLINKGIQSLSGDKEATLGTWLYDKFNDDPMAIMQKQQDEAMSKKLAASKASKESQISEIQKANDKKIADSVKSKANESATVINTSKNTHSATTTIITPIAVRNPENTLERAQSNQFWGRNP